MLIVGLFLAACSRAVDSTPTMEINYPAPEVQPVPYPEPSVSPGTESEPTLNPEIYPAPGKATVFDPVDEDSDLVRSDVELMRDTVQIILDDAPVVFVRFTVQVIDLCQQVRVIVKPPESGKINLEVYSVAAQDNACAQVVTPIVPTMTLGALDPGSYELLINGESITTFEMQGTSP